MRLLKISLFWVPWCVCFYHCCSVVWWSGKKVSIFPIVSFTFGFDIKKLIVKQQRLLYAFQFFLAPLYSPVRSDSMWFYTKHLNCPTWVPVVLSPVGTASPRTAVFAASDATTTRNSSLSISQAAFIFASFLLRARNSYSFSQNTA